MDSLHTNTKTYVTHQQHCIAAITAIAEPGGGFRIYVAWEWKDMADKGVFGFCKSRALHEKVTWDVIWDTVQWGWDIGGTGQEKEVFKNLF